MSIPIRVKAVKSGDSIHVTIPKQIVDYLNIKPGDTLKVTVQDSEILVKKEKKEIS